MDDLIKKRSELADEMRAMIDKCTSGKRDFTEDEEKEYLSLDKQVDGVNKLIEREQKLADLEAEMKKPQKDVYIAGRKARDNDDEKEFRNLGEFMYAVTFNRSDRRLNGVEYREFQSKELRDQTMGVGSQGGWAVPEKFLPNVLYVSPQEAAIRPRANVLPSTDPPDAEVTLPTLDQTANSNIYGGMVMYKVKEGGTLTESSGKLKSVTLKPEGLGGYFQITAKLVRNWPNSSSFFEKLMRGAMTGYEETQFYNGNGVGGPLGVLSHPCSIEVARTTANQIAFADVSNMFSQLKFGGSPIWLYSQTCLPQLVTLRDSGNNQLWQTSAVPGVPNSLYGYPAISHDRSVALGTKGDLILCDWNYYLIQNGSGPFVAASEHYAFLNSLITIKIEWNVDGKPWLTGKLPLEGSTSNYVSPFIILK